MKIRYDDILLQVNGFGRYQKGVLMLVALPQILNAVTTFIPNLILGEHKHRCKTPSLTNDTYQYGTVYNVTKCTYVHNMTTVECSSWEYDQSLYTETLISTFNMVCQQKFYRSHTVMAHHLGVFFGSLIGSLSADMIGRKPTFVVGGLTLIGANIILPWARDVYVVMFLRFLNGIGAIVQYCSGFILATELVIPSKRAFVAFTVSGFFSIGLYVMELAAYFLRDWHDLVLYTSIPLFIYIFHIFLLPESPRWLLVKGKTSKGVELINKMSKLNKSDVKFDVNYLDVSMDKESSFIFSFRNTFRSKLMLFRISLLAFNWIAISLTYYGIGMNIGKLGGDVFVVFLISISVGVVGEFVGIFASNKVGRKKVHIAIMMIGGVALLCTIFTSLYGGQALLSVSIALGMIGKFSSSCAFLVIYLYTSELAPTVLRGFVLSFCSCIGRLGSLSSSYIGDLGLLLDTRFGRALPLIICGSVTTAAGLLCIILPETKAESLPQTTKNAEYLGRETEDTNKHLKVAFMEKSSIENDIELKAI